MPVCLSNTSTVVTDAQIQAMIPALQTQVTRDFYPTWRVNATIQWLGKGQTPPPGAWVITVVDSSDVGPGVLGYHETDASGLPVGKVFAKDTAQYGGILSTVISHEVLETLADPQGALSYFVQDTDTTGRIYPCEVCDPVQSNYYSINGVQVSDFITPWWASAAHPSGHVFDHLGVLTNTLQIARGGYVSVFTVTAGGGWSQINAAGKATPVPDPDDKPLRIVRAAT